MGYWNDRSIDGEGNWEERRKWAKENVRCKLCGCSIEFAEKDIYEETGMCGHCARIMSRDD